MSNRDLSKQEVRIKCVGAVFLSVRCVKSAVGQCDRLYLPLSLARASISSKKTMEGATARAFRNTCRGQQQKKRGKRTELLTGTHDSSWVHTCTGNTAVINAAGYMMVRPLMTSKTKNINKRALAGKLQSGLDDRQKHPLLERCCCGQRDSDPVHKTRGHS